MRKHAAVAQACACMAAAAPPQQRACARMGLPAHAHGRMDARARGRFSSRFGRSEPLARAEPTAARARPSAPPPSCAPCPPRRQPIFLTLCHMIACSSLAYALSLTKSFPIRQLQSRPQLLKVCLLSTLFCFTIVLGNMSLKYIAVSFSQAVGAGTPFFTAVFALALQGGRQAGARANARARPRGGRRPARRPEAALLRARRRGCHAGCLVGPARGSAERWLVATGACSSCGLEGATGRAPLVGSRQTGWGARS